MSPPEADALIAFVYHEARLIDEQRFDEWLALFTEDGRYWMPLEYGQTDRRLTTSLMDEDVFLLRLRVERLKGSRTYSQKPRSRCHHVLQQPQIDLCDAAANRYVTWTPMHYVEARQDRQDLYRRVGDASFDHGRRCVADADETRRTGQLRRRLRQHSVVSLTRAFFPG